MKGVDPVVTMWLGVAVTIEQAIGNGTVLLTNVIPAAWTPWVVGWCNFLAFVGTVAMTAMSAFSSQHSGPLIK
jgi:hypothetical protein